MRGVAIALVLVASALASGCSTTLKTRDIDASSGKFPTSTVLDDGGVKKAKPFQAKYKALVYVNTEGNKNTQYNDFLVNTITKTNAFAKVAKRGDLEALVIERKLTDKVGNVSDLIGLNQLQKQIGPFLVVEPHVEWKGGYNFLAHIKAVDPETGETVLHIEQTGFNWAGLDDPLFFPLFNAFLQWTRGEKIATAPKK